MKETQEKHIWPLGQEDTLEMNGNPLQYSCLENSMDRGGWWATQSMGSQRVGHDWATEHAHIRRQKFQPQLPFFSCLLGPKILWPLEGGHFALTTKNHCTDIKRFGKTISTHAGPHPYSVSSSSSKLTTKKSQGSWGLKSVCFKTKTVICGLTCSHKQTVKIWIHFYLGICL